VGAAVFTYIDLEKSEWMNDRFMIISFKDRGSFKTTVLKEQPLKYARFAALEPKVRRRETARADAKPTGFFLGSIVTLLRFSPDLARF
jgi:hypothetical protein